jgi:hypothetical protein
MSPEPGTSAPQEDASGSPTKFLADALGTSLKRLKDFKDFKEKAYIDEDEYKEQKAVAFEAHNEGLKEWHAQKMLLAATAYTQSEFLCLPLLPAA